MSWHCKAFRKYIIPKCDGAGACHLVRGSLKAWLVYLDVALPPSSAPHLDIFVIQHSFASC